MSHLPKMLTTSAYFVYQNCIANNNNNNIDLLSKSRFNVGATKRCIVQNCTVCTASAEPRGKHFLLHCGWALPQYVLLKNYDQTLNLWKPWSPQCKSRINAGATKRCHSTEAALHSGVHSFGGAGGKAFLVTVCYLGKTMLPFSIERTKRGPWQLLPGCYCNATKALVHKSFGEGYFGCTVNNYRYIYRWNFFIFIYKHCPKII